MAWTVVTNGLRLHSDASYNVLNELRVAINQRVPYVSGVSYATMTDLFFPYDFHLQNAGQAIFRLRDQIQSWITAQKFANPSTWVLYPDLASLLTAAGYPSGWITTDYHVENAAIWTQLQDVFDVLRVYHENLSYPTSVSIGRDAVDIDPEVAWDLAKSGPTTSFPNSYVEWQYNPAAFPSNHADIHTTASVITDLIPAGPEIAQVQLTYDTLRSSQATISPAVQNSFGDAWTIDGTPLYNFWRDASVVVGNRVNHTFSITTSPTEDLPFTDISAIRTILSGLAWIVLNRRLRVGFELTYG